MIYFFNARIGGTHTAPFPRLTLDITADFPTEIFRFLAEPRLAKLLFLRG